MGWLSSKKADCQSAEGRRRPDDELAVLTTWAQANFTDETALSRLQQNLSDLLPEASERPAWIAQQITAAFSISATRRIYALEGEIERVINTQLRDRLRLSALMNSADNLHHRNETEALAIASRHAALVAGGMAAIRRIEVEAERLCDLNDTTIERRLSETPAVRLDALPQDPPRRRAWLRDALTGEAAAIAGGAMSPEKIAHAALYSMAPVKHERPADGSPIQACAKAWSIHTDPTHDFAARASRLVGQTDEQLVTRFGSIPGGTTPPRDPKNRQTWICRALEAEVIRPLAGLNVATPRSIAIDLIDIQIGDPNGGLHFGGTLLVDNERVCRITSPGEGVINADKWSYGFSADDLKALDLYIATTGNPRDNGETPDSLAAMLIDKVAMHVALDAYRQASAATCFFYIEEDNRPVIMSIAIPEGGSREGARSEMEKARSDAVFLDHMTEEEAAMTWITITA